MPESLDSLAQYESQIERGLNSFFEAGQALKKIRDARLYRQNYPNFEAYCRERWHFDRIRAHQLISASQTMSALPEADRPNNERQVRPLVKLDPDQAAAAWDAAQEVGGPQPGCRAVERAAAAVLAPEPGWQVGQQVLVSAGEHAGRAATVQSVSGLVVRVQTDLGVLPCLSNELSLPDACLTPQPASLATPTHPQDWTTRTTKPDRMQALEAELQLSELRCEMLGNMLKRLISLSMPPELRAEAQALIA